jgi:hypothetical protein
MAMKMDVALEAILDYCDDLEDTDIAEDRQKLHEKLMALRIIVWADDYEEEDLLNLILEIHQIYQSITDKTPYADIMKVVLFFQKFTVRTWKPKPSHVRPLLIELEKYA